MNRAAPMRFHPAPSNPRAALCACLTVALLGTAELAAQETGTLELLVTEAGTDQPVQGAQAWIETLERGGVANQDGRVAISGIPHGDYVVEVRMLGFNTVRLPVTIPRTGPLRVGLGAQPVALEGITVAVESALLVETRRRAIPRRMAGAFDRHELQQEERPLQELVRETLEPSNLFLEMCPGAPAGPPGCVRGDGLGPRVARFCVDERSVTAGMLTRYDPRDFYLLEIYSGGAEPEVVIYAYTHRFIERRLREGSPLSWFLPCFDPVTGG